MTDVIVRECSINSLRDDRDTAMREFLVIWLQTARTH